MVDESIAIRGIRSTHWTEAAGEFVSVRLPLFFAWFGCGVVLLLVLFVVWMSFVAGVPTQPDLTLQNYVDALDGYLFWRVIPNTAMVGLGTVAVVLFFSVPLPGCCTGPMCRTGSCGSR